MPARTLLMAMIIGGIGLGAATGLVTPTTPLPPPEPAWRKTRSASAEPPAPYVQAEIYPAYAGYVPPPHRIDPSPYDEPPRYIEPSYYEEPEDAPPAPVPSTGQTYPIENPEAGPTADIARTRDVTGASPTPIPKADLEGGATEAAPPPVYQAPVYQAFSPSAGR